jgi:hypothetical protein
MTTPDETGNFVTFSLRGGWSAEGTDATAVGQKAIGLALFPEPWRPPFFVLPTAAFVSWRAMNAGRRKEFEDHLGSRIADAGREWIGEWPRGLILRSSARFETLEDRGSYVSRRLAADFNAGSVSANLQAIYAAFEQVNGGERLAIIVQPLVGEGSLGHLSNERRISKTVNQWEWEQLDPLTNNGRLNSQRDEAPNPDRPLLADSRKELLALFRRVGRWATQLKRGTTHLEWAHHNGRLWLLQIDFEEEAPDDGVDPEDWFRTLDITPPGIPSTQSLIQLAAFDKRPQVGPRWTMYGFSLAHEKLRFRLYSC